MKRITIGITDCKKYKDYKEWFRDEAGVETINLGYPCNNLTDIKICQGVVLSGGQDIHPRRYNRQLGEDLPCEVGEVDEQRDAFEWKVMQYVQDNKLPLLGICRGLQLCNVFLGGTLVMDIPSSGRDDHSRRNNKDGSHMVSVSENSQLQKITGKREGLVNSAHHQSADVLGKGLVASAMSVDGVVEALEPEDAGNSPFLMLVQWHPERMNDLQSTFSMNIKKEFLRAVRIRTEVVNNV